MCFSPGHNPLIATIVTIQLLPLQKIVHILLHVLYVVVLSVNRMLNKELGGGRLKAQG